MSYFKLACVNFFVLQITRCVLLALVLLICLADIVIVDQKFHVIIACLATMYCLIKTMARGSDFWIRRKYLKGAWVLISVIALSTVFSVDGMGDVSKIQYQFSVVTIAFALVSVLYWINHVSDGYIKSIVYSIDDQTLANMFRISMTKLNSYDEGLRLIDQALLFVIATTIESSSKLNAYSTLLNISTDESFYESAKRWCGVYRFFFMNKGMSMPSAIISIEDLSLWVSLVCDEFDFDTAHKFVQKSYYAHTEVLVGD
ncbi:hypothetical protein [Photobacterium damselae]|uniref:hypothetical protein n=1 Tax=Photobacterium damselae TaxID=38293 RepID=UPI001F21C303|nr:hypothetical protein [Photobacterium damselae]UKA04557.1 hypothetical protein IHC89_23325 [Photobacterium damselae subsp. damselae]